MTRNWKTNVGQSILEEVPVQEHHKTWINAVSQLFGGLEICSLEALVTKDNREIIIEVNDCAMGLLGESQEEDRKHIAEVVVREMERSCGVPASSEHNPPLSNTVTSPQDTNEHITRHMKPNNRRDSEGKKKKIKFGKYFLF